jgi:hypothetical protein
MLNSGKCRLLDNSRLVLQLCSLERRTARGGRDSIDHPPSGHDDLANAVCGSLCLAAGETDYATLWVKFGAYLADPPARQGLDASTQAALIWRARGSCWRDYATRLDPEVIAGLDAIESEQAAENVG